MEQSWHAPGALRPIPTLCTDSGEWRREFRTQDCGHRRVPSMIYMLEMSGRLGLQDWWSCFRQWCWVESAWVVEWKDGLSDNSDICCPVGWCLIVGLRAFSIFLISAANPRKLTHIKMSPMFLFYSTIKCVGNINRWTSEIVDESGTMAMK